MHTASILLCFKITARLDHFYLVAATLRQAFLELFVQIALASEVEAGVPTPDIDKAGCLIDKI